MIDLILDCRSKVSRLNYGGFYTLLLEREDELICVATIRFMSLPLGRKSVLPVILVLIIICFSIM